MGMMINRRRAYGGKKLPYDYEVEYLELTGTQWIDTGVYGDLNTEAEMTYMVSSEALTVGCCIFGTRTNATTASFVCLLGRNDTQTNVDIRSYLLSRAAFKPTIANTIYTVHIDKSIRSIKQYNGSIVARDNRVVTDSFTTARTLKIGYTDPACGWYDLTENMKGRVYSCYIKKNGVLVIDLIPVRVGNIGYMYDKVSGQLFGNQGTGDFVLGPDK